MTREQTIVLVILLAVVGAAVVWSDSQGVRLFARAIAFAEGYGVPGAIPTIRNNPGDLKLPADGGAISTFPTPTDGWLALYRQLKIIIEGRSSFYVLDMTIAQMAERWTATERSAWAANVVTYLQRAGLPVTSSTRLREVLT